jgi:hypothetical protein
VGIIGASVQILKDTSWDLTALVVLRLAIAFLGSMNEGSIAQASVSHSSTGLQVAGMMVAS